MSSPGGEEVGRVSVRVVPSVEGFAQKLKAELSKVNEELTVQVGFDIDTAGLRAALEAMRLPPVEVPVEIDKSALDRLEQALATKGKSIKVDVDTDTAGATAKVDAFVAKESAKKINVKVDVDRSAFDRIGSTLGAIGRDFTQTLSADLSNLGSFVGDATSRLMTLGSTISSIGGTLGTAVAYGAAFAVAGAAVTAAWGAVSTAVAAIPAAIGLLGAPIATVMLGLDGIKKAANTLLPEFNKLKAAVSTTFQTGLTQVFTQLKGQMTALTPSIQAVATSLVGLAQQTANWITKANGAQQIRTMFDNVAGAIGKINLTPLLDGFTRLAGNKAALQALVTTINGIGTAIQKIADNADLESAFQGLEGVLSSLTTAFTSLVNNGIKLFAAAAPGIKSAIDSITGFFGKFDYQALGTAVGGVFKGIGDAIAKIPPSTIQGITTAFQGLAKTFQSAGFANTVAVAAGAFEAFIKILDGAIQIINSVATRIVGVGKIIKGVATGDFATVWDGFKEATLGLPSETDSALSTVASTVASKGTEIGSASMAAFGLVKTGAETSLGVVPGTVSKILNPIPNLVSQGLQPMAPLAGVEAGKVPPAVQGGLAVMDGLIQNVAANATTGLGTGLAPMGTTAGTAAGAVPGAVEQGASPAADVAGTVATSVTQSFAQGLTGMSPALQTEVAKLGPALGTGLAALGPALTASLAALAPLVTTGFVPVQTAFTTAFTTLRTTLLGTETAGWTAFFTQLFATFTTSITTGMTVLTTGFTTGFTTLRTTLLGTETAAWTAWFTQLFTAMGTAVATSMVPLTTAFTTGFTTLRTTLLATETAAWTAWFTQLFTAMGVAITTAMVPLTTVFTTGFTTMRATLLATETAAWTAWFTQLFTAMGTAVTTAMVPLTAAFTTGFATVRTAIQTAFTGLVQEVTTGMTNIAAAVTAGQAKVVAAFTAINAAIVAEVNKVPPQMTTIGNNIVNSLAAAITAGQSKVVNAIVQMIQQAIQAATSALQIGSPSKVSEYWGDMTIAGYVNRVNAGENKVVKAMENTFGAGVDAAQGIVAKSVISPSVITNPGLDAFHSATKYGVTELGRSGVGGGYAQQVFNFDISGYPNATAKQLANEMSYRMRTARRGVHSGR